MQCSLDRLIAPSFYKVHNSIEDYTHFWLCGGRGSTKSSFVSVEIILGIMKNADTNAVVMIDEEDGVVKKIVYGPDFIELHSINPMYPVRRFENEDVTRIRVFGLVREIKRKF
jgi:phage terminase large subunit